MKVLYCLRKSIFLLLLLKTVTAYTQLTIDVGHYQIDTSLHLIVCNTLPPKISSAVTTINFDKTYTFTNQISSLRTGEAYKVSRNDTLYTLYFTQLPLINLNVSKGITDKEIGGKMALTDTTGAVYESQIGIKTRGAYSSTLPKKSYRVQLWSDTLGTTKDESMFGLRSDKRWLLLAMYNEKLRLNNKTSHELWLKMHKLYYADDEPNANATIRTRYVEVFLNNTYQGVYLFAENQDRKELRLKKQSTAGTGGELYKGNSWDAGTLFYGVPNLPTEETELWGGWELSYPDADQTDWKNIYDFTKFVVNSSDNTFTQEISAKIREDNFADYFIFLNLLRAEDNQGKNLFLARYDEKSPYFIAPWDLDGTWGYYWSGDRKNVTNDLLSNNLFNRLLKKDAFKSQVAIRWFSLRRDLLSIDSLFKDIETNYRFLVDNGVYERESLVWSGSYLSYSSNELTYIKTWLQNRVNWLDKYFKEIVIDQPIVYWFTATVLDNSVELSWRANCAAIQTFDLEASSNQSDWHLLTQTSADANGQCVFSFLDTDTEENTIYYRLKITDNTDAISYSSIILVTFERSTVVKVFPNPVSTTLQVQGDIANVMIFSSSGIRVYESSGILENAIDTQHFPNGIYVVRIQEKNGSVSSHRVIVNR